MNRVRELTLAVGMALIAPLAAFPSLLPSASAAADASTTIASAALSVSVDKAFPRIISYTDSASGNVLNGNEDVLTQIKANGTTYTPTVTSTVASDHIDYVLTFNGDEVDITISVAGAAVDFKVTRIVDATNKINSLAIPQHNLVSVRSSQTGAALTTTLMNTNTTGTGDTHTSISSTTAAETNPRGAMYAIVNTGQLAASISTNSTYDAPSGATAQDGSRIYEQTVSRTGYVRSGLWSGDWLYRAAGSSTTEPLPDAKIVIAGDRNTDGTVDWQDGAIAFRDIMTSPQGWQDTADRVVQRVPMNFASQATQPFLRTLDETKRVYNSTDGLGQFVLLKGYASEGHDSAHPDYGQVGARQGGAADLNMLTDAGAAYNADFGVHVNATEAYPVAKSFDPALLTGGTGWDWLDQSYVINSRLDGNGGTRLARLQQLKDAAPNLKFVYVDVWYGDGWQSAKLAREINGLGFQLATEFPAPFEDASLWSHWSNDINYGGSNLKGVNSQVVRFIRNQQRDDWISGDPMLGGGELTAYEGWQHSSDYNAFLKTTFSKDLPTKYLQGFTIKKWAAKQIDFDGGVSVKLDTGSTRTITKDGHAILSGGSYLLPWSQTAETKLYHWNAAGGTTTWSLPSSWSASTSVKLYKLTEQGRSFVSDLAVSAGQVSINAAANTAYVVYPTAPTTSAASNFGEGQHLKDPSFMTGNLNAWTVSGNGTTTVDTLGRHTLDIGSGATDVSQTLTGLTGGQSYSASVYVQTAGGRSATISVTPATGTAVSNYVTSSPLTNGIGADKWHGTPKQRMEVLFDVPVGQTTATLTLKAAAGTAAVSFGDVRILQTARTPQGSHYFYEDFENTTGGWGAFVYGGADGTASDPRTHVAQLHAPYTQAGWSGKTIDDVIDGNNSLKAHEEGSGLRYRSLPQTIRFLPGHTYSVTMKYEQGFAGDYAFVTGTGATTTTSTNLAQARTSTTFTATLVGGANGDSWIGIQNLTGATSDGHDLVIDDVAVDDLGGGGAVRLAQSSMSVKSVDSAEVTGENGAGANVLDGNAA
ncbi:endo-alpha-N-acetylgalactosaminidase family protein, partial [Kitasatospora sp. NPDC057015]|uniref:endo-alpha-N-acetylgalactosaminidase family protein n=1 Tax=Kitasatospora sp. NPDC057015 TaxID=3346001 RepID=UPI00363EE6E3